jgi:hypothetical protein
MASARKTAVETAVDGGTITDTGVIGRGYIPDGGTTTSTGVIGKPVIGKPSSISAPPPTPLPTIGTIDSTGVPAKPQTNEEIILEANKGADPSLPPPQPKPQSPAPIAGTATAPIVNTTSRDWRISEDDQGGFHHVAPNSEVEKGHKIVPNSNTTNASDAMWKFRGMRNAAKAATPASAEPIVEPKNTEPSEPWTPWGFSGVANSRPAPPMPEGKEAKPNWWASLRGTSLDAPARLKIDQAKQDNYNALNRKVGDQQTSFTDMQKRALPDSGEIKTQEVDIHQEDLLARGETVAEVNANGVKTGKIIPRIPSFEENPTMSSAKEKMALRRSRKWKLDESTQKQWRARYFR